MGEGPVSPSSGTDASGNKPPAPSSAPASPPASAPPGDPASTKLDKDEYLSLINDPAVSEDDKKNLAADYYQNLQDENPKDFGWDSKDDFERTVKKGVDFQSKTTGVSTSNDGTTESDPTRADGSDASSDDEDLKKDIDKAEKSSGNKVLNRVDDNVKATDVGVGGFQIADPDAANRISGDLDELSSTLLDKVAKDVSGATIRDKNFGNLDHDVSKNAVDGLTGAVDSCMKDLEVASGYLKGLSGAFAKAMAHYKNDEEHHVQALKKIDRNTSS